MDRRDFLKDAAQWLLVLPFGTFLIHCSSDGKSSNKNTAPDDTPPDAPPRKAGSNVVYTSNLVENHAHSFTVPKTGFENAPVGGVMGLTTEAGGHQHRLSIDQEALRRASEGDIVKVETDTAEEHTHMFTVIKVA
jgi:hypothetical protein